MTNSTTASDISVEVSVVCDGWLDACPEIESLVVSVARAAVTRCDRATIVDVTLTDDAAQRDLNRTWRGKDGPTNVLSFGGADPRDAPPGAPLLLGDVVLALETVAREAAEQRKPLADHLSHLVVHGVLHLLGFDHQSDTEAAIMEAREIEILRGLGVPDPYRDTM